MFPSDTPLSSPRRWRVVLFSSVAGLVALAQLFVFGGALSVLEPWNIVLFPDEPGYHGAIHLWHQGQWAALMGIVFSGALLASLWRPQTKPLLVQFYILSLLLFTAVVVLAPHAAMTAPEYAIVLSLAALVAATYPRPRALIQISQPGPFSRPLLGLSGLAVLLLAPICWQEWQHQLLLNNEHAQHYHYASACVLAALLVLAGALAATKRPGWWQLGTLVGVAFSYLGLAAMATSGQEGSWGMSGGALALLGGIAFVAATAWEARRQHRVAPQMLAATTP